MWKLCYFDEDAITASGFPVLNSDEIHIWYLSARGGGLPAQAFVLSEEEQERAARYRNAGVRQCYQIGHIALRLLLARYLDCEPERLVFWYNEQNKPSLADMNSIHFNISHSGDWIVIAFAKQAPVGVDIEYASGRRRMDLIVNRFFHPREAGIYSTLSEVQRRAFFYEHWTAREAALKALGIGLTVETNSFLVHRNKEGEGGMLRITDGPAGSERLVLVPLCCPDDYFGCVAMTEDAPPPCSHKSE